MTQPSKPKSEKPSDQSQTPDNVDMPPPKVEFPCDYPIRVVGDAAEDFVAAVSDVIERHAPGFDPGSIKLSDSRNGRFQSIRVVIHATGETQLRELFEDLKATGRVHMVL